MTGDPRDALVAVEMNDVMDRIESILARRASRPAPPCAPGRS